jgi:uncharacterized membrane protein YjfL (UPF0719 family)
MNYLSNISSLVYLLLLLVLSCVSVHATCRLLSKFNGNRAEFYSGLVSGNRAIGLCYLGYIISMTIMMKNSISSGMSNLQSLIYSDDVIYDAVVEALTLICMQFILSFALSLLVIYISSKLYQRLTDEIQEMEEISKGNEAVALVYVAVLISISTIMSSGVDMLVSGIIPLRIH